MTSERKEIEDSLLGGRWEVDCVKIDVTQNDTASPEKFTGKGYLRQGEGGLVQFRLYPSHPVEDQPDRLMQGFGTPGKLIAPSGYSTLVARDFFGREWICPRVQPDTDVSYHHEGAETIVHGTADSLEAITDDGYPERIYFIRVVFFVDVKVPANSVTETVMNLAGELRRRSSSLDTAIFETEFGKFTIRTEPGKLVVSCESQQPPQEHFFVRVMEGLSFVFGRRLYWNYVEEHRHGKLTRRLRGQKESDEQSLSRPIEEHTRPCALYTWQLFARYLSFISSSHNGGKLHPCSRLLFPVYQARQGTIEARALALGVAVEGLCKELFPETAEQSTQLRVWVRQLRKHCEAWDGFNNAEVKKALYDRLGGLVGQLNTIRAKDTLMRLVAEGVVYERHVKAWGTLRNQAAHANMQATGSLQELVDLCEAVTMLLYHLIFKTVGYEGAYIDRSEYGYPTRWFRGRKPTEAEIAVAAYYLYLKEPDRHGNDLHHWFTGRAMLERGQY